MEVQGSDRFLDLSARLYKSVLLNGKVDFGAYRWDSGEAKLASRSFYEVCFNRVLSGSLFDRSAVKKRRCYISQSFAGNNAVVNEGIVRWPAEILLSAFVGRSVILRGIASSISNFTN